MPWLTFLGMPFGILVCWLYIAQIQQRAFPKLRGKRICLLIAHPDDEAMFFAPTVLALTEPSLGNHVKILCLSSGDADGLGETRKKELVKSGLLLGLRKEEDVFVIEDHNFPDSITTMWDPSLISKVLSRAFVRDPSTAGSQPRQTTIDVLVTFDRDGVSFHPNHRSLYHGSLSFLADLNNRQPASKCPITLYTLTSTAWLRKYTSIVDSIATMLQTIAFRKMSLDPPTPLLFVSSPSGFRKAQTAMTKAHKSQMRWFRWGWIGFSRYMIINDLKLEKANVV